MIKQQLKLDGASYSICLPDVETDYIQGKIAKERKPYELEMLRDMAARLQPGDLVLDVGANIGNHTLYLASVAGCRVHAFEPNQHLCDALVESIELNGMRDRVAVHQVGVAERDGFARFSHLDPSNLGAQSLEKIEENEEGIKLICLDQIDWEEAVKLIKIDVEGMEMDVLRGAANLILRDRPILYVESQTAEDFTVLNKYLRTQGYFYCATFNATPTHVFRHESEVSVSDDVPRMLAEKVEQIYAFKEAFSELQGQLRDCNDKYRKANERIRQLEEQCAQVARKYRDSMLQADGLKLDIERCQLRINELELEARKLSVNQGLEAEKALLQLERQKNSHEIDLERWAGQKELAEREIFGLREQLAKLEQQLDFVQVELGRRSDLLNLVNEKYLQVTGHQVPELKEKLAEQVNHAAELQQRMGQQERLHAQTCARLEADIHSLEQLLQSVQKEREELANHYREVRQELSIRLEDHSRLNGQHQVAMSHTIPQLEEALASAQERFTQLEHSCTEQQKRLEVQARQLNNANQKYRHAIGQVIPQLKQKLSEQIELSRELRQRAELLNSELKQTRSDLSAIRRSLAYKAGLHLRAARASFKDAIKLPVRLWRLRQQLRPGVNPVNDVPRTGLLLPPTADDHVALRTDGIANKPNSQVRMACIMDDFTFGSYQPECGLFQLTPDNWRAELEAFQPEVLFIESAWRGKDELWGSKVGHCSQELQGIVAWCRERHVPTLFWNKEDPVHFETFLTTAQLFDFVFTTDIDCIHRYKAALGHEHVYFLPFACQPAIHNPIEKYVRKDAFCFAGAYYARYPERTRDLESFVRELPAFRSVEIYDRNFGKNDPNYQFPDAYQPHIVGTLPFSEIDKAYKGYRFAINLNSIKQSQTMFARRVYELLGSNTLTISNYSRGVRLMFGDLVVTSDNGTEIRRRLEELEGSAQIDRVRLAGLRKVISEHTYTDRLNYLLEKITGQSRKRQLPAFTVVAMASTLKEAEAVAAHVARQKGVEVELALVCSKKLSLVEAEEVLAESALRARVLPYKTIRKHSLQELAGGRWVAGMLADDYYGSHYLLDCALATRYSRAQVIGKATFFHLARAGELQQESPGKCYQTGVALAARRAVIHPVPASALRVSDWLMRLADWVYDVPEQLSIDSYNYCQDAGAHPASEVTAQVADLLVDSGVDLARLAGTAEGIAPLQSDLEHAPWLDGNQLGHLLVGKPFTWFNGHGLVESKDEESSIQLTRNSAISSRLLGPLLEIDSQLPDGKHDYLYASKDLPLQELQQRLAKQAGDSIPLHLQIDPGLNLSLVLLYLNAEKERLGHQVLQANRNLSVNPPEGTVFIRVGLRIYAGGSTKIHRLVLGHLDLEPANIFGQSDVLLLTNHYPSYDDLYRNGFVHSRVKAYCERNVKVDVFRLRKDQPISWHEFQDVDVTTGSQQALRRMLANGYRHVLVHFLDPDMWEVLKDFVGEIKVTVWVHGAEVQPWWRREYNYVDEAELEKAKDESAKRLAFWRAIFENLPANLNFVFVSRYFADEVMEDVGLRLPESHYKIIHNPVDTDLFDYVEKDLEQRRKILSIRPYASRKYANDLSVKAVLELSKESFFEKMHFKFVGDGQLFDSVLAPLRGFRNVEIQQGFLSQNDIAKLHKEYGIFLCPTRMDAQGVSKDEAMSSGLIPVTNGVTAIPEFVDEDCGVLAGSEDYEAMARGIKDLYLDPTRFAAMSKSAAERARRQVGKKHVILEELALIERLKHGL